MKKTNPLFVLFLLILISALMAFSGGAPMGVAGDPASIGATCRNCHSGPVNNPLNGVMTSNIPPSGYTPGSTYTITANFVRAGHSKFGFEISPQSPSGTLLGSMAVTSTQTKSVGSNKYITHSSIGTSGSGSKTWSFNWTAPATGLGPVTFYGAFNATNANNMNSGDSIFTSTLVVTENPSVVHDFRSNDFSFSAFPNPTVDNLNVSFILEKTSDMNMDLLDISGNKVMNLPAEEITNGEVNKSFDISSLQQGIYFIRLNMDENISIHKILKIK